MRGAVPTTIDFAGGIATWLQEKIVACSEDEAIQQAALAVLRKSPYQIPDKPSKPQACVIMAMQRMMIDLGFDQKFGVRVTGFIDGQTQRTLSFRFGPQWEITNFHDIMWELKAHKDSGYFYGEKRTMAASSLVSKVKAIPKTYLYVGAAVAAYFLVLRK